jgi:Immunity protein 52
MSRFFVGAYWSSRKESIDQCADRLRKFFVALAACDPVLATWFEKGRSRKQALQKPAVIADQGYLLGLLNRGRNRRDVGGTVIEELGFHVGLWNGESGEKAAGLGVRCGLYWTSPNPNVGMSNCVALDLPEHLGELKQTDRMSGVMTATARAWEPEWAGVMSKAAMDARMLDVKAPFVDWMVYVSQRIDGVLPPSSVVQLENGTLIVVQPGPPSMNSTADQENVRRIENILRQ